MTPDEFSLLLSVYFICASGVIFLSLFTVAVFLGFTILDIWYSTAHALAVKMVLCICATLYPEIGVIGWAVYFGRSRHFILRLVAFGAGGVQLLLQMGWFYLSMHEDGVGAGLISGFMAHIIWWPFVLVGGAVSFFVLRTMLNANGSSTTKKQTWDQPES